MQVLRKLIDAGERYVGRYAIGRAFDHEAIAAGVSGVLIKRKHVLLVPHAERRYDDALRFDFALEIAAQTLYVDWGRLYGNHQARAFIEGFARVSADVGAAVQDHIAFADTPLAFAVYSVALLNQKGQDRFLAALRYPPVSEWSAPKV